MITDLNKILVEWAYQVKNGKPNHKSTRDLIVLDSVLKDFEKTFELLDEYKSRFVNGKRGARYWLKYIFDYILKTKLPYNNFKRFLVYRKKSDEIWGQNFNDYFENYQIEDNKLLRVK